ncbi:cytoplasmic 60S subunit biogenesis factor Reh1p [[Candida] anglica]|uniref:Cytoplasmic 60S subunit biogenesis factor Reh1p n=1 Tax=[Candida] anglica TaxID=148631 RepID=A0ABP0EGP7_9ASCO
MSTNFMPHGSNPQTASYTCNTCAIKFPTAELQRKHMKAEWHRYNLKRRVADLPAISSSTFADLVLTHQKSAEDEVDEFGFAINHRKPKSGNRQLTKKELRRQMKLEGRVGRVGELGEIDSESAAAEIVRSESPASIRSQFSEFSLGDHHSLVSSHAAYSDIDSNVDSSSEYNFTDKSHTDLEEFSESDSEDEEYSGIDSDSYDELKEEITTTTCFFCGLKHTEREDNIKHMFYKHGLYIPERSYLVNPDGLLLFLAEVIMEDLECIVCGFQGKNLESVRQHMSSKGHCKIPYESKEERAVISEFYNFNVDDQEIKKNKKKKSVAFTEGEDFEVIASGSASEEDENEELNSDEDSNYTTVQVDASGVELTLPTGSRIGHRSMTRYYRQNLPLSRDLKDSEKTLAMTDRRYAPGLTVAEVTKQEKIVRRVENRAKNQFYRKDKNSQINFQKHFRDELLGPM